MEGPRTTSYEAQLDGQAFAYERPSQWLEALKRYWARWSHVFTCFHWRVILRRLQGWVNWSQSSGPEHLFYFMCRWSSKKSRSDRVDNSQLWQDHWDQLATKSCVTWNSFSCFSRCVLTSLVCMTCCITLVFRFRQTCRWYYMQLVWQNNRWFDWQICPWLAKTLLKPSTSWWSRKCTRYDRYDVRRFNLWYFVTLDASLLMPHCGHAESISQGDLLLPTRLGYDMIRPNCLDQFKPRKGAGRTKRSPDYTRFLLSELLLKKLPKDDWLRELGRQWVSAQSPVSKFSSARILELSVRKCGRHSEPE